MQSFSILSLRCFFLQIISPWQIEKKNVCAILKVSYLNKKWKLLTFLCFSLPPDLLSKFSSKLMYISVWLFLFQQLLFNFGKIRSNPMPKLKKSKINGFFGSSECLGRGAIQPKPKYKLLDDERNIIRFLWRKEIVLLSVVVSF